MPKNKDGEAPEVALLEEAADAAELDLSTLVGDLRDGMLEQLKQMGQSWQKTPEAEQMDIAAALQNTAKAFVDDAVALIRADGKNAIIALLVDYADKGDIVAKLKISKATVSENDDVIMTLHNAVGKNIVITQASSADYQGQRGDAETEPDQPEFDTGDDSAEAEAEEEEPTAEE